MPDGPQTSYQDRAEALLHRPDRKQLVCFCADAATEEALRAGLAKAVLANAEFIRADAAQAIALLRDMPTPWTLLVDVSGHPQPLAALDDLAQVVEPDVRVLVVGDRQDVGFYRQITRSLGVVDYLYKPLSAGMVAEHFGPIATGRGPQAQRNHGGRLLSVTGVRGGVGASTIAANLAWYLSDVADRHTVVLDADLHRGSQALLLGAQPGAGLRNVLEHPSRVDEVFVDRAAAGVAPRLHLLAAEEALDAPIAHAPQAAEQLLALLRRRYNFIVADAPFEVDALGRALFALAQHRILVLEPTLACIRDTLRLLQLPSGPHQTFRPLLVLNKADRKGGLPTARVAEALKLQPDIVIPDQPKRVEAAATLGKPAAATIRGFRNAIGQLAQAAGGTGHEPRRRRGFPWWRR